MPARHIEARCAHYREYARLSVARDARWHVRWRSVLCAITPRHAAACYACCAPLRRLILRRDRRDKRDDILFPLVRRFRHRDEEATDKEMTEIFCFAYASGHFILRAYAAAVTARRVQLLLRYAPLPRRRVYADGSPRLIGYTYIHDI